MTAWSHATEFEMKCLILFIYIAFLAGSVRSQIIGGERAKIENFPYQASVHVDNEHNCGGCIISERHILTTAHCVDMLIEPYDGAYVYTGTSNSRGTGGKYHSIASIKLHPLWSNAQDAALTHDIAIITLAEDIRFNKFQQKIELASEDVVSGTDAVIAGWGRTSTAPHAPMSIFLYKLRLTLIDHSDCQTRYTIGKLYNTQLCAISFRGQGTCFGDSGSPLVNDLNELVGLLSWSFDEECDIGRPDVYTNVYAYSDFIWSVAVKS